jgi:hypothetical protein
MFESMRIKWAGKCRSLIIVVTLLMSFGAAIGQDDVVEQPLVALTEAETLVLDQLVEKIEVDRATIKALAKRLQAAEGIIKTITYARLDLVSTNLLRTALVLANETISLEGKGKDSTEYRRLIEKDMVKLPAVAFDALDRIGRGRPTIIQCYQGG